MTPHRHQETAPRKSRSLLHKIACEMSPLENRRLLSVSIGPDGYTTFGPSPETEVWYVSSSTGNDNNPGTEAAPFRTIAKGKSMLRDGQPDQLLLKRDDTFNEVFGNWTKSGKDSDEYMLLGSYGNGANRPIVRTNGLDADGITLAGGSSSPLRYLAIQGIRFTDNTHSGTEDKYGIRLQRTGSFFYIEDVQIDNFKDGIVIGMEKPNPGVSDIMIRRNVIVDQWQKVGHSQGIYASGTTNRLTIEQNVLDKNGWKEGVSGAEKTVFNHNIYINYGAQNIIIRDNISTRASLRGILSRGGGIITGNLTARNAIGIEAWGDATISNNVILESGDVPAVPRLNRAAIPQGFGIQVVNETNEGGDVVITDNIVAQDWSNYTYNVFGIRVWYGLDSANVQNNIVYDWRRPFFYRDNAGAVDLVNSNNQFQIDDDFYGVIAHNGPTGANNYSYSNNTYWSPRSQPFWAGSQYVNFDTWQNVAGDTGSQMNRRNYLDPNREIGAYNQFIGGTNSFDAFINAARSMQRQTYNPNYTAAPVISFIRQGFNLGAGVGTLAYVQATDEDVAEPSNPSPNPNPGQFTVFRTGPVTNALTVNYTLSGTATYGADYNASIPQTGQITFPAGAASVVITITPIDDTLEEDPESVDFRINSGAGYDPGAPAVASFQIVDGDSETVLPPDNPENGGGTIDFPLDPVTAGTGLRGVYYGDSTFSDYLTERVDSQVNFDYQMAAPAGVTTDPDSFSVIWSGYILSDVDGEHSFRFVADDAVRLYINDLLIIDTMSTGRYPGDANNDGWVNLDDFTILAANFGQSPRDFSQGDFNQDGTVNLDDFTVLAGRFGDQAPPPGGTGNTGSFSFIRNLRYDIRVEYVEYSGTAGIQMLWTKPGDEEMVVPQANLFPPDEYEPPARSSIAGASTPPPVATTEAAALFSTRRIADELEEVASVLPA